MRNKVLYVIASILVLFMLWSAFMSQYNIVISKVADINLKQENNYVFIEENEIQKLISPYISNADSVFKLRTVDLSEIERTLKNNAYVDEVQAYVSMSGSLHVEVAQKTPIFRLFNNKGVSFYVDKKGSIMPLSPNFTARVPVVTGFSDIDFPGGKKTSDSSFTKFHQLVELAQKFYQDPFLNALIEQVYVTESGMFEMVPKIDNHIIRLGNMDLLDDKILRLKAFYKEALVKFGWNRYALVDVSFKGQIVCKKREQ